MRSCARWFALMTVRTRAMDLRRSCLCPTTPDQIIRLRIWREREDVKTWNWNYILFSLEAFPPDIFCTRNWPSSVFSSRSCFWRSSFVLPHNWTVLILVVLDCHPPTRQPCVSQSRVSFFYHLVGVWYVDLRRSSGADTCGLARRARKISDCAAVPALIVVKR